jgi:hypothetical protein
MLKRLIVVAVGLFFISAAGCAPGKYARGGRIPSVVPDEWATFAFIGKAEDTDGDGEADTAKGQVQYHDKAVGVSFHGEVTNGYQLPVGLLIILPDGTEVFSDLAGQFLGTYQPQPASLGEGGDFTITVIPFDANTGQGDLVIVELFGGVLDGYSNLQFLDKGNIELLPLGNG